MAARQTAADLGITATDRLPKKQSRTLGGVATAPIMILKSLRVGSAEVCHVDVASDVNGQLPTGLLGMTFLRHFNVTVDRQLGQVRFERSRADRRKAPASRISEYQGSVPL